MKCPIDNTELTMSDRQGIEIDYCPQCRGVWLDRGELDKIVERSEQIRPVASSQQGYQEPRYPEGGKHGGHDNYRSDEGHGYKKKRRESWLGELFD